MYELSEDLFIINKNVVYNIRLTLEQNKRIIIIIIFNPESIKYMQTIHSFTIIPIYLFFITWIIRIHI